MAFHGTHLAVAATCSFCGSGFLSKHTGSARSNHLFCSAKCKVNHRLELRRTDPAHKLYEIYSGAKHRAKRDGRNFKLSLGFLEDLWREQNGHCLLSGRKFQWGGGPTRIHRDAPTLDRIDSSLGYTKDNVRLITYQLNIAINHFGLAAFQELAQEVCYRG